MIESSRHRRSQVRHLVRHNRSISRAVRALRTDDVQPLRVHLIGRGLDPVTAKRFAGAMSRTIKVAAEQRTTVVKLKGRATRSVPVWMYRSGQVAKALRTYRPRDTAARAQFERIAA
jgi:hypothetical protein